MYSIQIGNATAKQWVQFSYEFTLNGLSNSQIALDGVSSEYISQFDVDNEIKIYKNGNLKYRGIVTKQQSLIGGGIVLNSNGIELELTDDKVNTGSNLTKVWTTESDNNIFNEIVTGVTGWTTNVTNSTSITLASFRVSASESVWNCIIRLISIIGKDIYIDQENKIVFLYDKLNRSDKFAFIEGKNANNISRGKFRSKAGKVIVYGKGDGNNQITGSFGSLKPVEVIIDRNIISQSEANKRAETEYNKLNPNPKEYSFNPISLNNEIRLGDSGNIINNSALINEVVDIVRYKIIVTGTGNENIDLQVTNSDYRIANKSNTEMILKNEINYINSQSSMQGSGNLSQYSSMINGNNSFGLTNNFYIGDNFFDEVGVNKIDSIKIDFQLDKYRSDVGTASESNKNPNLDVTTFSNDDNELTQPLENDSEISPVNIGTSAYNVWEVTPNVDGEAIIFFINANSFDSSSSSLQSLYARILNVNDSEYYPSATGLRLMRTAREQWTSVEGGHRHRPGSTNLWFKCINTQTFEEFAVQYTEFLGSHDHIAYYSQTGNASIYVPINPKNKTFRVQLYTNTGTMNIGAFVSFYVISQHKHGRGTYRTDLHKHDVSISSNFQDEAGINATGGTAYLEYWNGASWITKSTIALNSILELEKDISSSGSFPDVKGWWRVRVITNNSSPDLIKCITTIKHSLDN